MPAITNHPLWGAPIGEWREDSPAELYDLFLRHQRGQLSRRELDELSRLLMHVVAIQFRQHRLRASLPRVGLAPEDVAQEALLHVLRKIPMMQMQHAGYRPMLSVMNVAIYRFVLTQVAARRRKRLRHLNATDYLGTDATEEELARLDPSRQSTIEVGPSNPEEVAAELATDEAIDAIVGDIPTTSDCQAVAVEFMARTIIASILAGEGVPARAGLPPEIGMEVSFEQHCLVVGRVVRRFVRTV